MAAQDGEQARHPERDRLEALMRGALPRAEAQAVIRHLLAGCESCRQITGRLWRLSDEPLWIEGGNPLMNKIETAQEQLREIVRELGALKLRLLEVKAGLLSSPTGSGELQEEEPPDLETEIRTVIECVLQDSLEPAIGDLRDAAAA